MKCDSRRVVAPWLQPVLHPPSTAKVQKSCRTGWAESGNSLPCSPHVQPHEDQELPESKTYFYRILKFFHSFISPPPFLKKIPNHVSITEIPQQWVSQMDYGQCGNTTSQFVFNPLPNNFLCCPHSLLWLLLILLRRLLSLSFLSYFPLEVSIPTNLHIYSVCEQAPLKLSGSPWKCA